MAARLGTLALRDLRAAGVAPIAVLSLMARLGSSEPVELRASVDEVVAEWIAGNEDRWRTWIPE